MLTRRGVLERAAVAGLSGVAFGRSPTIALGSASRSAIPLPSPRQVRAEITQMVSFGARLTGSEAHNRYIAWLEAEFVRAGLELKPCEVYETERWLAERVALELLDGPVGGGAVKVASYYTRSRETPPGGVTGPLVYGGTLPALSVSGTSIGALQAAVARYPSELASWAAGLGGLAGAPAGSILVVDLPVPVPLTGAVFLPSATHLNWPGHSVADWAAIDYKRVWIEPGLSLPLAPFQSIGAAGVVFIVDASYEALAGAYLPFTHGFEPVPALYVDRDTGRALRARALGRPRARLTLTASRRRVPTPSVTAVLPGSSSETIIFNTHTDGQGFVEENAGVAFVQLARYFGSRPAGSRLRRTLVFAAWPGHMVADLPQAQGWIEAHPELVGRAAAALTVEHLGCTEWTDSIDRGYHATGEPEFFGIWTTQGKMFELTRDTVIAHGLSRTALLRPPVQFGVGGAFQSAGVPQIGAIAGPEYLLTVSAGGDLDKLDEALAARQIAWLADLATRIDGVPATDLRAGDPTLGSGGGGGSRASAVVPRRLCGPVGLAVPRLIVRWGGWRSSLHGLLVVLRTDRGSVDRLTIELWRGRRVVASARVGRAGPVARRVVLRRRRGARFAPGSYALVVRGSGVVLARQRVRIAAPAAPRAGGGRRVMRVVVPDAPAAPRVGVGGGRRVMRAGAPALSH